MDTAMVLNAHYTSASQCTCIHNDYLSPFYKYFLQYSSFFWTNIQNINLNPINTQETFLIYSSNSRTFRAEWMITAQLNGIFSQNNGAPSLYLSLP